VTGAGDRAPDTIWTIGHSTRTPDQLLELLRTHGIAAIADVRRFPASRRHPHFNREALALWLPEAGVRYEHVDALGGRRSPRPDSRNTGLQNASFRGYADYMATPVFHRAIDRLLALSRGAPTAVMCAEAVWWRCHRSLISDFLSVRGIEVRHILDASPARRHRIQELARAEGDQVCYPGLL
jgi:uncharacterized protein (DUF488 family)